MTETEYANNSHVDILRELRGGRMAYREAERREIAREVPDGVRTLPLVPFFSRSTVICELKQASPSRGVISLTTDPALIVEEYVQGGAERFSVLTERNRFLGSWKHLRALKQRYPGMGFLRKDFLSSREDVQDSWRIGADAVLLIAAMLQPVELEQLTAEAHRLGLQVLCEAHTAEELKTIMALEHMPDAVGINARDLKSFKVNLQLPFALRQLVPAEMPVIFESGAQNGFFTGLAANAGFFGVLAGESLMRSSRRTELAAEMIAGLNAGMKTKPTFFTRLMRRYRGRPLVKICGLTDREDAEEAARAGADVGGFILAPSVRQISMAALERFKSVELLKCVVVKDPDSFVTDQLLRLLEEGTIDGVQLHGGESPELLERFGGNAVKAVVLSEPGMVDQDPFAPLSLYDRPKDTLNNSLGEPFPAEFCGSLKGKCIAGGIAPENLRQLLADADPLLIDLASGVEKTPGLKDHVRIKQVFNIIGEIYG